MVLTIFLFLRSSHRVRESRPLFLLTEAAFIYNQEYGIKLSLNWEYVQWHLQSCNFQL